MGVQALLLVVAVREGLEQERGYPLPQKRLTQLPLVLVALAVQVAVLERKVILLNLTVLPLLVEVVVLRQTLTMQVAEAPVEVVLMVLQVVLVTLQRHLLMVATAHLQLLGKEMLEEHGLVVEAQMMLVLAGVEQVKPVLDIQLALMRVGQVATDNLRLFLV